MSLFLQTITLYLNPFPRWLPLPATLFEIPKTMYIFVMDSLINRDYKVLVNILALKDVKRTITCLEKEKKVKRKEEKESRLHARSCRRW